MRKSPIRHKVKSHLRQQTTIIHSYIRGRGQTKVSVIRRIISNKTFRGWHISPTGKFLPTREEKATEGTGYYFFLDKEEAKAFVDGQQIIPVSVKLRNPLDVRGKEIAYILHESDKVMEPLKPEDPPFLDAVKEAVKRSGTTDENWNRNLPTLNRTLTKVLIERGYDGLLIDNWGVKFETFSGKVIRR